MGRRRTSGFTLIELVVVIAVLAVLAGVAMPALTAVEAGAKVAATEDALDVHERAVLAFAGDAIRAPRSTTELLERPAGLLAPGRWLGPYLTTQGGDASLDAWGSPLRLTALDADRVELRSAGENRAFDDEDDHVRIASVAPELSAHTRWVVATVNAAIARYQADAGDGRPPLSGPITKLVAQLQGRSLLNDAVDWSRDAYGVRLATTGAPVSHVSPGTEGKSEAEPTDDDAVPGFGDGGAKGKGGGKGKKKDGETKGDDAEAKGKGKGKGKGDKK